MRGIILKLLLKLYNKSVRDFTKLSVGEEFSLYRLGYAGDTVKLIKSLQTAQILAYFEAKTEAERNIIKGSSMILKIILDNHNRAMDILEKVSDSEKQLEVWEKYRLNKF